MQLHAGRSEVRHASPCGPALTHMQRTTQAQKVVQHLEKVGAATGSQPFVWTKKVEKELEGGKKLKDISIFQQAGRLEERMIEIDKVRKRQDEREAEKARREEELVSGGTLHARGAPCTPCKYAHAP
jgi:hypothetical protein